jgi:hypothetical protein
VDAREVRAYVERGWATAAALKEQHWAREFRERGPEATVAAALALHEHMQLVNPDWPSESDRQEDLAHHVALKRAIDGAARAFILDVAR